MRGFFFAGGRGVEPLFTVPETAVLPLDEPPIQRADFTMQAKIRLAKCAFSAHLCYNNADKNLKSLNTKNTKYHKGKTFFVFPFVNL